MSIIAAAIKHRNVVFTGVRHGDIVRQLVSLSLISEKERPITAGQQGFIDSDGEFKTRSEARFIAMKNGQIPKSHKGELYSEDLW